MAPWCWIDLNQVNSPLSAALVGEKFYLWTFFQFPFYFPVKLCIYRFLVFLCIYRFPCRQSRRRSRKLFKLKICLFTLSRKRTPHGLLAKKKLSWICKSTKIWPLTEQQNTGARFCQIFISPWDNSTDGHFFQFPWMSAYERVDCAFLKW